MRGRRARMAFMSICAMMESRYASRGSMKVILPARSASSKSTARISASHSAFASAPMASVISCTASRPPSVKSLMPL